MFGRVSKEKVVDNVRRAVEGLDLKYDEREDNSIVLGAMGDDNPIGMVIVTDDEHKTLNIYCYLMFDIPDDARAKLIPELNTVNNTINHGGFYTGTGQDAACPAGRSINHPQRFHYGLYGIARFRLVRRYKSGCAFICP